MPESDLQAIIGEERMVSGAAAEAAFDGGDFFALRDMLDTGADGLSETDRLFYSAACANAFGRTEESEGLITEFLSRFGDSAADDYVFEILKIRADNILRGFRYGEAARLYAGLLDERFAGIADEKEREEIANSVALWSPLEGVPPQRLETKGGAIIPCRTTSFRHISVEVEAGGVSAGFLFDTGANLSAITESQAARMGMRELETDVKVITSTGAAIRSRLAVADRLSVGGMVFSNVIFLLLRDEELVFEELDYRIEGVVGIPVIRQMREVWIGNGYIEIPGEPSPPPGRQNLCFEGMMPVVEALSGSERLVFTLDTGANRTELSHRYWTRNRERIESEGIKVVSKRAGGGGVVDVEGYELPGFPLSIGGREAALRRIGVSLEPYIFNEHKDGNLGLDVLRALGGVRISFEGMFVAPVPERSETSPQFLSYVKMDSGELFA